MLHPNQFKVNQAWISVRLNDELIYVQDEPYDMYVLLDAASTYIFGPVFCRTVDDGPALSDIEELFRKAASHKNQYPDELIVPDDFLPKKQFKTICDNLDISFREVPKADLGLIVDEIKDLFQDTFMKQR
jgi:hypothetical protein